MLGQACSTRKFSAICHFWTAQDTDHRKITLNFRTFWPTTQWKQVTKWQKLIMAYSHCGLFYHNSHVFCLDHIIFEHIMFYVHYMFNILNSYYDLWFSHFNFVSHDNMFCHITYHEYFSNVPISSEYFFAGIVEFKLRRIKSNEWGAKRSK